MGSREQDTDLRPLQTGEKTDPAGSRAAETKAGGAGGTNKAICGEAFGVIWLNVLQGRGAHHHLTQAGAPLNAPLPGHWRELSMQLVTRNTERNRTRGQESSQTGWIHILTARVGG